MYFIVLCGIISFIVQMIVLYNCKHHRRILCILPVIVMELLPLWTAAHAFITKQPSGVLGWKFELAVSGWIAVAIVIGYAAAWVAWRIFVKEER